MCLNFSSSSSQTFHYLLFINSTLHLPHHLHLNKPSSLPLPPSNFPLPSSSSLPSPHHLHLIRSSSPSPAHLECSQLLQEYSILQVQSVTAWFRLLANGIHMDQLHNFLKPLFFFLTTTSPAFPLTLTSPLPPRCRSTFQLSPLKLFTTFSSSIPPYDIFLIISISTNLPHYLF